MAAMVAVKAKAKPRPGAIIGRWCRYDPAPSPVFADNTPVNAEVQQYAGAHVYVEHEITTDAEPAYWVRAKDGFAFTAFADELIPV